jgi:hypothetical protein
LKTKPLLLLIVFTVLPIAQAQTYSQPLLGISWQTHTITIGIPDKPSWAAIGIEDAIADWNTAQLWFIQTYFPTQLDARITLTVAKNFSDSLVKVIYVADGGQFWTGNTEVPVSGPIVNETILVVVSRLTASKDMVQVVEHELGHVLGLDHTAISVDLMYAAQDAYTGGEPSHPSTLNLFGVFLLGMGCGFSSGDLVSLPPQIPYLEWYPGLNTSTIELNKQTTHTTQQASCPNQTRFWQQPTTIFSVVVAVIIIAVYMLNSRRKKVPRPSQFMKAFEDRWRLKLSVRCDSCYCRKECNYNQFS